jgi:hypothetical protein
LFDPNGTSELDENVINYNNMREDVKHEQMPSRAIELDPTWTKKLSELQFESFVEEMPSPVQSCKLSISKTAIYISRTDFFDVAHSNDTPIFEQVARLLLNKGKIVDVKIDNATLAPDTFKQLADADPTFREIVKIFNVQTKTPSASDAALEDLRKRSNAEVKSRMDQKKWCTSTTLKRRPLMCLWEL